MTILPKANVLGFKAVVCALCMFAVTTLTFPLRGQQPDATAPAGWHSDEAVHLIGLPDIREKKKGSLSISSQDLIFTSTEGRASVSRSEISSVTVGDVRVETGGTTGKIARAIIPFGGGSALATVSNKQLSLLTVEFRDERAALHGVVFLLPKDQALLAQQQFGTQPMSAPVETPHGRCVVSGVLPDTIKVAAITIQGDPVPAEYKVLLYEQLVRRLRAEGTFTAVYRDGDDDPAAACPKYNLALTLSGFKKGNAAVRASTGPVGLFVGATSLKIHAQVQALSDTTLIDEDFKASQRGDTDSLNLGDKIAKSLTKDLKKANMHAART